LYDPDAYPACSGTDLDFTWPNLMELDFAKKKEKEAIWRISRPAPV
jgi:hypothetical protein